MKHFDVIAIGAGPFNLGFAALAEPIDDLRLAVVEAKDDLAWHPGMMLPGTHLQVPFMADLVTMADPSSQFSFLNYLKVHGRIYPFYIRENFYALRKEYSNYLAWAASRLPSVHFGHQVLSTTFVDNRYVLSVLTSQGVTEFSADNLVLGTGSSPYLPAAIEKDVESRVIHTSQYAFERDQLISTTDSQPRVHTVLGSGQSAAEVVLDLLQNLPAEDHLIWATRSERFFPLEYTKLTLEMTSPEYIDHFYALPQSRRDELSAQQKGLYKGINADLVNEIHEHLYQRSLSGPTNVHLRTGCSAEQVRAEGARMAVTLKHERTAGLLNFSTDTLILATGYRNEIPDFLRGIRKRLNFLPDGRYDVDREYGIGKAADVFVQNAELHTHGFTAPDLGMGAYRNSVLLNRITGREAYPVEERIAFQKFGAAAFENLPASASNHA